MADRRRQVILLLGSRYDGLYLPPGALRTDAGFVPQEIRPCTACDGAGTVPDRYGRRVECARCNGLGRLAFDLMDARGLPVGSEQTTATARPRTTTRCDRCNGDGVWKGARCELCDGAGRRDLHAFELHLDTRDVDERDPMLAAIEARDRSGSYAELERALAGIRVHVNKPARYAWLTSNATAALRLIDDVTVSGRPETDLQPGERALFDLAIAYIVDRMPDPIKVPAGVIQNARELREHRDRVKRKRGLARQQRDAEVRAAVRRGQPTQHVAAAYGLSVSQVNRIVAGESEPV